MTPPGYLAITPVNQHAANLWLTSTLSSRAFNEVRVAFQRLDTLTAADDPASQEIPSIEIAELGLAGFNAAANRTAIGLAVNLPQFRNNNTYQVQDNFTYIARQPLASSSAPTSAGSGQELLRPDHPRPPRLLTLQRFVDDVADTASINRPMPGGQEIQ